MRAIDKQPSFADTEATKALEDSPRELVMIGPGKAVYTLILSNRKSLSITITRSLEVVVRAPQRMAIRDIERIVRERQSWIDEHMAVQRARVEARPECSQEEAEALRQRARDYLPGRVEHYARLMGCYPTGLKITSARTRFGSCGGENSLCFSYLLMRYPKEAIDYVVVHELAHIAHKNHGKAFYQLIERYMPDYRARRAMLKT